MVDGIVVTRFSDEMRQALVGVRKLNSKGVIQQGLVWHPDCGSYVLENADLVQALPDGVRA